jgi:hypothetical protein
MVKKIGAKSSHRVKMKRVRRPLQWSSLWKPRYA